MSRETCARIPLQIEEPRFLNKRNIFQQIRTKYEFNLLIIHIYIVMDPERCTKKKKGGSEREPNILFKKQWRVKARG